MTLHVNTITPNHIISVSDRLLYTPTGYVEDADDRYKHFFLFTDDARVVVTFAGFAGIIGKDGMLEESTIDWLIEVIMNTAADGRHRLWEDHIKDIKNSAEKRVSKLQKKPFNVSLRHLRLAIYIAGDYRGDLCGFIIENSIEKYWTWAKVARDSFRSAHTNYSGRESKDGFYIALLGEERLAMRQRNLYKLLVTHATKDDVKNLFQASVNIIRAVSKISNGSVGLNCSGVRISRNNPGSEYFNDRDSKKYDVAPNCIHSTSKFSGYVGGFKIYRDRKTIRRRSLNLPAQIRDASSEEKLTFLYRAEELLRLKHNEVGAKFREKVINENEWKEFQEEWFRPRSNALAEAIVPLREKIFTSSRGAATEVASYDGFKEKMKAFTNYDSIIDLEKLVD